ncbi:MAG: TRAP transporter small permease [Alphaproteobacteria bacterium]
MEDFRARRDALAPVEDVLHWLGCLCLAGVLALITADTILRYTINRPIAFQFELTEMYLMPTMATLSLARVQRLGGHLAIDFVRMRWFGAAAPLIARMNAALPAIFFAALTWQAGRYAWAAYQRNDIYMGVIDWPTWIAYAAIPVGTGMLTLRLVADTLRPPPPRD